MAIASQLCDGWLVDEAHKSPVVPGQCSPALNGPYCSG
jgi:hypothetical protein